MTHPAKKILKDFDFHYKEEYIKTTFEIKEDLLRIIEEDCKFFMGCGLIDYSLIVFKVDRSDRVYNKRLEKEYGKAGSKKLANLK